MPFLDDYCTLQRGLAAEPPITDLQAKGAYNMQVEKKEMRGSIIAIVGEKHIIRWDDGSCTVEVVGDDGEFTTVG